MRLYTNVARIGVTRKILVEKPTSTRSRFDSYQLITVVSLSLNFAVDIMRIFVGNVK